MSRELLFSITIADCDVQTFAAGGKGGQHQNKTQSGVRVLHRASGAVGEARDSRSQHQNKRAAFTRMASSPKFQRWARLRGWEILSKQDIEKFVDELMKPENIRVEIKDEHGRWVEQ